MTPLLQVKNVTKVYGGLDQGTLRRALDSVSLTIYPGEFIGVMGASGSGKTTLLQLLGGMKRPTSGDILFCGRSLSGWSEDHLTRFRRKHLGFIFQSCQLLNSSTLYENILLPLILRGDANETEEWVKEVAVQMGISNVLFKYPHEVSGGQKQRAAVARALIHQPDLLLADEPTGKLDSGNARSLLESLTKLNREEERTILMVTHDPVCASYCRRVIFIRDGRGWMEIRRGQNREAFFHRILAAMSAMGGNMDEFMAPRQT